LDQGCDLKSPDIAYVSLWFERIADASNQILPCGDALRMGKRPFERGGPIRIRRGRQDAEAGEIA
jgi:hypothetical protein